MCVRKQCESFSEVCGSGWKEQGVCISQMHWWVEHDSIEAIRCRHG